MKLRNQIFFEGRHNENFNENLVKELENRIETSWTAECL